MWFDHSANNRTGIPAPPFIMAEIGVNHDGDIEKALTLVDAAADAGADAVKTQFFQADLLMGKRAPLASYQQQAGETDPVAMLRRLELDANAHLRIVDRAHARRMRAVVTVFSVELVDAAMALPWDAVKTASPDIVHKPLLEALARSQRPLIVSTGAADEVEVARALRFLQPIVDDAKLAVLHCVSAYPTPDKWASLGGIEAVADITHEITPRACVGYSDHTQREDAGLLAALLGARVLEKHITLDRTAAGPDHAASLDPAQFARYVAHAREVTATSNSRDARKRFAVEPGIALYGQRAKRVLDIERDVRTVSRQSIITSRAIATGERISPDMLTFRRPGAGVSPWDLDTVVGSCATRDIAANEPLTSGDFR